MAKEWAKKFYKSKTWLRCREAYIVSVQGLCETCLEDGKHTSGYMLHHIIHLTPQNINDPNVTTNLVNLKYECKECHDKHEGHGVGNGGTVTTDGLKFNSKGELVQYPSIKDRHING